MEIISAVLSASTLAAVLYLINKQDRTARPSSQQRILVDTSALIDGRLLEVAEAGFISGKLLVPKFVVAELQHIADSNVELRRARGRLGLEVIRKLQGLPDVELELISDDPVNVEKVDDKLVALAAKLGAAIMTTDFNLNKVATISEAKVLNVNELAQSLRPLALPGEKASIKLVQRGSDRGQAVGYLSDGTMVVVDRANRLIGTTVNVEVTRVMQTVAGKMLFAKLLNGSNEKKS
jgi:uncharacterized protein YacL